MFRGGSLAPASNIPITGISVLMHYELLLSKILEQNQAVHSPGRTNPLVLSNFQNKTDPNGNDKKDTHYLHVIVSDITLLTKLCVIFKAEANKEEDNNEEEELERATHSQLFHVTLPAMIRLATHYLSTLGPDAITTDTERMAIQKLAVAGGVALLASPNRGYH